MRLTCSIGFLLLLSFPAVHAYSQAPEPPKSNPLSEQSRQITNNIGMKLVLIPAGEFLMGSDGDSKGGEVEDDEKPQHRVRITRPFYLGITEVTQGQYQRVMGENPSFFRGSNNFPVERVSWDRAIAFCNKLSEREALKPYYRSGVASEPGEEGYRLPTEAEWEYACRAGTKTRYSFGDDMGELREFGWFNEISKNATHDVAQKKPNGWGLYDMHGNVWEWCDDGYDVSYYQKSPAEDPPGPHQAAQRVNRGGAWSSPPLRARTAYRRMGAPDSQGFSTGFRVARGQVNR